MNEFTIQKAEIQATYVLMAHSIGGAYANRWSSKYPEEIEGIVFVDGSQPFEVGGDDKIFSFLVKLGFADIFCANIFIGIPIALPRRSRYLGMR